MILVLLCLCYARYSYSLADLPGATAMIYPRESQTIYFTSYRSTVDIIQSCLATIFACTWVALHLDVPEDRSTWWKKNKEQIYMFLAALIAPEMVVVEGMEDWRRARVAMLTMADFSFTLAHCHFLTMGGVVFRTQEDKLERFNKNNSSHLTALKKHAIDLDSEISARSKSSPVAKGLVVIQVSWFVFQCIARGVQRLAITELEIMTLAYAVLNGATYALWWHKPAGVEVPLIIDISKDQFDDKVSAQDHDSITTVTSTLLGPSRGKSHNGRSTDRVTGFLLDLSSAQWNNFESIIVGFVGSIFGGLHCIAFSFEFPSPVASMLWKVCALYVTICPLPILFLMYLDGTAIGRGSIPFLLSVLLTIGYAVARIILVVISFWALTSIPLTGHQTVMWTQFIPHL